MKLIVFTGGGTGGHIYPGIAVIGELLKNNNCSVIWIGSSKGVDRKIVEDKQIPFIGIPAGKLRRYFSIQNMFDLFKIFAGFIASVYYLIKLKPVAVFSKGGFVSVPPCFAAKLLKIPVYTHECDFTPGLATKLNARVASHILVSYKETAQYFEKIVDCPVTVSGNPVRSVFYEGNPLVGKQFLNIPENNTIPILLILGGSLGARQINNLIAENIDWLCQHFIVVHQTGSSNIDQVIDMQNITEELRNRYKVFPYFKDEMPHILAAADIVLSRSGANSLWECAISGKPMILIPLSGTGTRGDQVENAQYFEKKGAAIVLYSDFVTSENLKKQLTILLTQKDTLSNMIESTNLVLEDSEKYSAQFIANLLIKEVL